MTYNWQLPKWPDFTFDALQAQEIIISIAKETGEINGILQGLPKEIQSENLIQLMLIEAIKTSEIEGEYFSREDVMSSIKNNLGINARPAPIKDRNAEGIAKLMVEVRKTYFEPLSIDMLKLWHHILMENSKHITYGQWRTSKEPMLIISGSVGKEVIHFEAPPSAIVTEEMIRFVNWFNTVSFGEEKEKITQAVLQAAIGHLYFESIHPFEDGNGRIGRALAEKALSFSLGRPIMLSLSNTIEKDRKRYYAELKKAQSTLEITDWIIYFANVILQAQKETKATVQFTLKKSLFFDRYVDQLNDRQLKALNTMFKNGLEGFTGGMTATKYMKITRASKATATRDLQHLTDIGALLKYGGGRSVHYNYVFPDN